MSDLVQTVDGGKNQGRWIKTNDGTLGIVHGDGKEPYLAAWTTAGEKSGHIPTALHFVEGQLSLQIPSEDGRYATSVSVNSLRSLLAAAKFVSVPKE